MSLRTIEVVDYNQAWRDMFALEHDLLASVLTAQNITAIHHIGSTSVTGLNAKPIIDILIEVKSLAVLDNDNNKMASIGYVAKGEYGISGRRYFQKGGEDRTHQVHAFLSGSDHAIRHLAFRDYLIAFPDIAAQYGTLKKQGASLCVDDIDVYCAYKNNFVKEHEAKAIAWIKSHKSV